MKTLAPFLPRPRKKNVNRPYGCEKPADTPIVRLVTKSVSITSPSATGSKNTRTAAPRLCKLKLEAAGKVPVGA